MIQMSLESQFRCYVVTVENKFRGHDLISQFQNWDIPYEMIYGINGSQIPDELTKLMCDQTLSRILSKPNLTMPEICCAKAHIDIYERMCIDNIEWALVVEDDITFRDNPMKVFSEISKIEFPSIISLNDVQVHDRNRELVISNKPLVSKLLVELYEPRLQTCSYLINLKACKSFFRWRRTSKVISRADWPIEFSKSVRYFFLKDSFAIHPKDRSASLIVESRKNQSVSSNSLISKLLATRFLKISGITSFLLRFRGVSFRVSYSYFVTRKIRKFFHRLSK